MPEGPYDIQRSTVCRYGFRSRVMDAGPRANWSGCGADPDVFVQRQGV